MSVINSQPLIGASGNQSTAYNLTRSLRFRSSASAFLNRTPSSAGNRKTWTWSAWVKRGSFTTTRQCLFGGWSSDSDSNWLEFGFGGSTDGDTNDSFYVTTATVGINSSAVFRDPSAWYHVVVVVDTTQATAANRFRLWINGVNQNLSALSSLSLNLDAGVNQASNHSVSKSPRTGTTRQFDGYMAEVNFIDGQALDASSFGETDTATGVWKPKKYTGTYGTNGYYLKFDNLTSTSTLGNDSSGNSNTWTVNNISLTSGATYDSMKDVPTLTDADTANYAVLNPLNSVSGGTLSNGNLTWQSSAGSTRVSTATTTILPSSKTYFEMTVTTLGGSGTYAQIGIVPDGKSLSSDIGVSAGNGYSIEDNQGNDIRLRLNGSSVTVATAVVTGDTLQVAVDQSTGKIWFGRNNTWYNSTGGTTGDPAAGTNETATVSTTTDWYPAIAKYATGGSYSVNFGQRPFAYTPPSGFKALNTFNI